ncbi:ribonuclease H-like domain-containing protein [Tanacetum coccineum]|uniref:Ribonuclease H-like domain-containing protein n=1 Tax=Tanacetum coccineum TaxID=301880 RepID=A0ABQ4X7W3_9ASTR
MTLQDPANANWHMDTGASSHLNSSAHNLSTIFNSCMYPSVLVGDGKSIPVTNTGHSTLPTPYRPLHLNNVLVTPNIDFRTRQILLRCDSTGELYPVTSLSYPQAFLVGQQTWHQLLGHLGSDVPLGPSFSDLQPMLLGLVFSTIDRIIASLHAEFSMTDLGPLNYFLGVSVTRNTSGMFLSQQKYATEVLERAGMLTCNPCRTPVDTDSKLAAAGDPVSDPTLYRRLAGALQYLTFTRPDISYAVQQVCLFMHDPREPHFSALKRILRYVRGTLTSGLQLYSSTTSSLVAYSDADWAGCPTTRRSTSGYCVFLGNNLLSWSSKRQFTLSRSSAEAEYRGVANAVAETCWLRNLLRELHTPLSTATIVYCDNVSAVYLSSNPVQHQRTKHIEIDIHFVRDLVTTGHIRVLHVPSRYQYADIFTKGLPTALFDEFRDSLSVRSSPAQTAGGC